MPDATEHDVFQRLLPPLAAEGYEVYFRPGRTLLPPFFENYTPTAIARRDESGIAFEISRKSQQTREKVAHARKLFKSQPNWELRVLWLEPSNADEPLEVQSPSSIKARIAEIRVLARSGHPGPSLLLGWSTFEAVARTLMADVFARPQTPGRLVEILAMEGHITPTEADTLRALITRRNQLVHGGLDVDVTAAEMEVFAGIIDGLLMPAVA